jgi:hypothetical protein
MLDDREELRLPFVVHLACWVFCVSTILGWGLAAIMLIDYRSQRAEISKSLDRIRSPQFDLHPIPPQDSPPK